jgi:hypothetical protein
MVLFAVIEFAFVFSAMLGISYATRDAALLAAEAGNGAGADCVILKKVVQDVGAPASPSRINSIVIYRANADGTEMAGISTEYDRVTGAQTPVCGLSGPAFYQNTNAYPEAARCNVLLGCVADAAGTHATLDTIGVRIVYVHQWVTPLGGLGGNGFGGQGGSGFNLTQSNSMRMEPIL